jgi:hypothetical protein
VRQAEEERQNSREGKLEQKIRLQKMEENANLVRQKTREPNPQKGQFLNLFLRLWEKLAPMPMLDLALVPPRRELAPIPVFKNWPQVARAAKVISLLKNYIKSKRSHHPTHIQPGRDSISRPIASISSWGRRT